MKNSAPIAASNQQSNFPTTPNRSPLLSPLVGDAKAINALSLEPGTPNLPGNSSSSFLSYLL